MFDLPIVELSSKVRTGTGKWIAEAVATAGLLLVILRAPAGRATIMAAVYIGAAYWFTASTSFANPGAAFGRMRIGSSLHSNGRFLFAHCRSNVPRRMSATVS